MKHTVYLKIKIVTWTLLFSFCLGNGTGWALLPDSDQSKGLMPATQGLQPAKLVVLTPEEVDAGYHLVKGPFMRIMFEGVTKVNSTQWQAFQAFVVKYLLFFFGGRDPYNLARLYNLDGGDKKDQGKDGNKGVVTPVVNPNPVSQNSNTAKQPLSKAEESFVNAFTKALVSVFSRRDVAQNSNSDFFTKGSFSSETDKSLSKNSLVYDYKSSDLNSFFVTFMRELTSPRFTQGSNIKDYSTTADVSKILSFEEDISVRDVHSDLSQVKINSDVKNLSGIEVGTVFNEGQLKDIATLRVNGGGFFFTQNMIQELLQREAYQVSGDQVHLQSGEEPSSTVDSLKETNVKIDLMRSLGGAYLKITSFTALTGDSPSIEESNLADESLLTNDPPVVPSAANTFRELIKKYPGLSIHDMNVKLIEGHLDLDQIGEGYFISPLSWIETSEPAPISSALSIAG